MDRIIRVRRATDIWNPKSTEIIFIIHTEFETSSTTMRPQMPQQRHRGLQDMEGIFSATSSYKTNF